MAQKAIRELFGKKLIYSYLQELAPEITPTYKGFEVNIENISKIRFPKFSDGYVAKPDELFGKRGKNGLVFLNKNSEEVLHWIRGKMGKPATIFRNENDKGVTGNLSHFIIEPLVNHTSEYYLAIKTTRDADVLYFSPSGGINIEENWDKVIEIKIPFKLGNFEIPEKELVHIKRAVTNNNELGIITEFIKSIFKIFRLLDFSYLEVNPFTLSSGKVVLLDLVARLDDTAEYKQQFNWTRGGKIEFPTQFGGKTTEAESKIHEMDMNTGASLKFSVLNPQGRIWMLTSGGGGSVIFADTVGDLGFGNELANYGEYSGNPTTDETESYATIVIAEMLKSKTKGKILIIGGGIANFTDVKETFKGVIKAITKHAKALKQQQVKIFVRRGGPNYKEGLALIESEVKKLGIPIEVYGPETYMTEIIKYALKP